MSTWKSVDYEIEQNIARGNELLGIKISGIKDMDGMAMTQGNFPDKKDGGIVSSMRVKLNADLRSKKNKQDHPKAPLSPPRRIRRAAGQGITWGISRTMTGYRCVSPDELSIQGKAPKWILIRESSEDDFYIAKLGSKNGRAEVLTELFNNELGSALGFEMAHHGIVLLDDLLYFLTKNFRLKGTKLQHGSLVIADALQADLSEVTGIPQEHEQMFYEIPVVHDAIHRICGHDGDAVFQSLVNMLVLDALIGCCDRHFMNWGVLMAEKVVDGECQCRLAPIFDTARALAWGLVESKLLELDNDDKRLERFVLGAHPCIGPKRDHDLVEKHNHFDLIKNLFREYPHQIKDAVARFETQDVLSVANRILRRYPYRRGFTGLRKRVIIKILRKRFAYLYSALWDAGFDGKEGANAGFKDKI